jgi:microcystin-dependent protein
MALDNAQFIAELSITDPPGSDPLSQGDDQIRTIKRATQQSFPNIDKAVTLDADALNLAAIKNEANVFTAFNTFPQATEFKRGLDTEVTQLRFRDEAGVDRWDVLMRPAADNDNFALQRRGITGTFIDFVFQIDATTGVVDFAQPPTVAGAPLWIAGEIRTFVVGVSAGANWFVADGTNGTANLADRWLNGSGITSPGASLVPNLVGTAAAGATGGTALTEAQLPAHNHTVYITNSAAGGITDININTSDNVFGGRRNDASKQFAKGNGTRDLLGLTGSGNTHSHSSPAQAVTENGTSRDTVRPLSFVVQFQQYVP